MTSRFLFGTWDHSSELLSRERVREICRVAGERRSEIASFPLDQILEVLDALGRKWSNRDFPPRQRMLELLPATTGFSSAMVDLGLDELGQILNRNNLEKKIQTEFHGAARGKSAVCNAKTGTFLKWHPLGAVLHVLSGNVFLVGPGSLVEGLLTGNVSLLKLPASVTVFIPEFIDTLVEVERELGVPPTISRSIATLNFSSHDVEVIEELKRQLDGIVVWGGESAVQAYRNHLPARCRLVVFGPKLSIAVLTEMGLAETGMAEAAKQLATQLAIWDQNACTAPQMAFVIGDHAEKLAGELLDHLELAMAKEQEKIPSGAMDPNQAAEIRKIRTTMEIAQIRNQADLRCSAKALDWTVYLERGVEDTFDLELSPLHRTLKIVPLRSLESLGSRLDPMRAYIQTVGLAACAAEHLELADYFGSCGVLRVMKLDGMSGGEIDDPHDGQFDLPQLMNLVVTRIDPGRIPERPFLLLSQDSREALINERLRRLIRTAKHHPLYRDELTSISVHSVDDLQKLAIRSRAEIDPYLDPRHNPTPLRGGYVTRSGGSTGVPAFSYFDREDWEAMVASAVDVFRACGLSEHDHLANCFMAGELYGSFLSFDDVNRSLGVATFPFAGHVDPKTFVEIWQRFDINTVQGIPAVVVTLLRKAKEIDPTLQIEKVLYAGMPMNETDRDWLKQELGTRIISSVVGTTEAGQIAYQSSECVGNVHNLIDDYTYLEVVDDHGAAVPTGTVGRVVVTALQKFWMPVIRYAIGDKGRILPANEQTGLSRQIEYLGRCDDIMSIGFMNIRYDDFERALKGFGLSTIQLVGTYGSEREVITVNVEGAERAPELAGKIRKSLLSQVAELDHMVVNHLVDLVINCLAIGELPRNPRTGKLRLMIDARYQ